MSRILLTHSPETLRNYYGDRALAGLRALAEVKLHEGVEPLAGDALVAAASDCDLIVSYRQSPGEAQVFERFQRGHKPESLGLGLAIVKKICNLSNASIDYHYNDHVHTFTITFPEEHLISVKHQLT